MNKTNAFRETLFVNGIAKITRKFEMFLKDVHKIRNVQSGFF